MRRTQKGANFWAQGTHPGLISEVVRHSNCEAALGRRVRYVTVAVQFPNRSTGRQSRFFEILTTGKGTTHTAGGEVKVQKRLVYCKPKTRVQVWIVYATETATQSASVALKISTAFQVTV